ncbi:hypothetical protein [Myxococcus sp. RHSTA-1-4]|uniref:hypothetical protein n=1 Tax=Myxococcus sp. RHSTA-1-4 TaxID=2874601 RepID=UPI001CBDC3C5|nr:hypothetical protein [Myxococcus sp. RHSTA-1-4]MBZ4416321.1 hypothetical protein [Myxococcus sp. RHSTA-1-4]
MSTAARRRAPLCQRKRYLNLEVVGLEGAVGAPPPWERQLIEPALAKVLDPKQAKTGEARDATVP